MSAIDEVQYLKKCVTIDPLVLEEEFVRVPADLAYWGERYAVAYGDMLSAKAHLEHLYARLYQQEQSRLQVTAKGRVLVGDVESAIQVSPEYVEARAREIVMETEKIRLSGILESLRAKRDALISIGAQHRAEMQQDPMIRRQDRLQREVETGGGFGNR